MGRDRPPETVTEELPASQVQQTGQDSSAYIRFIILASARTGSTMLASSLNAHPEIVCFQELFNPVHDFIMFEVDGYDNHSAADRAFRDADPKAFLQQRIFGQHAEGIRAVGFKLPYEHIWLVPDVSEWLNAQKELRVVHLKRRNLLRSFVSFKVAEMTGIWEAYSLTGLLTPANALKAVRHPARAIGALRHRLSPRWSARQTERPSLALSVDECTSYFDWAEQNASQYEKAFEEHALSRIYYEDLVADRDGALGELQTFLGVRPRSLPSTRRQQTPHPLRELIANYDELREAFRDTEYAVFFD